MLLALPLAAILLVGLRYGKAWYLSSSMYSQTMSQLLLDIAPDRQPTLDNFVVGRNLELLSALRHALSGDSSERCFLCVGRNRQRQEPSAAGLCERGAGLQQSAVYAQGSVPSRVLDWAHVVAVDDVEQLDDAAQIELFDLYNQMRDSGAMLLVSGMESPLHLKLRDDLRTRLGWGLVYQVHVLSDEEKAQALDAACPLARFRAADRRSRNTCCATGGATCPA